MHVNLQGVVVEERDCRFVIPFQRTAPAVRQVLRIRRTNGFAGICENEQRTAFLFERLRISDGARRMD
jgi:hypothetical protein